MQGRRAKFPALVKKSRTKYLLRDVSLLHNVFFLLIFYRSRSKHLSIFEPDENCDRHEWYDHQELSDLDKCCDSDECRDSGDF